MNAPTIPPACAAGEAPPGIGAGHTRSAILLVDDHELVRLGFRALVAAQTRQAGLAAITVHEAGTLAQALAIQQEHDQDIAVVVLDLSLTDSRDLDGLIAFRKAWPLVTIDVLSGTASDTVARDALALGAAAFFPKSGNLGDMLDFVQACVTHGVQSASQRFTPPWTTLTSLSQAQRQSDTPIGSAHHLTTRQLQTLQLVLQGKSNREIGELTHLSEGTVKNHVSMLLLTFGVRSRSQLISKMRS